MTLKEFAKMLDGREYGGEITKEEEALAKELGFVAVFGYSDDNAELRGAIDDEIGCFGGGVLEHNDLPDGIYANWCPEDLNCSWEYVTSIPHETFTIYEDGELYCIGIVCDINKSKQLTRADRIRAMSDEELAAFLYDEGEVICKDQRGCSEYGCKECILDWLKQPVKGGENE